MDYILIDRWTIFHGYGFRIKEIYIFKACIRNTVDSFLEHTHSWTTSQLQIFTAEQKSNYSSFFLESLITLLASRLGYLMYRKPTDTDRCLSVNSQYCLSDKFSVVIAFMLHAFTFIEFDNVQFELSKVDESLHSLIAKAKIEYCKH